MTKLIIGLCAAVVLLGGSALVVANHALPGDLLYGVKLGVNERIGSLFAGQDRARAEWHIKIAERRLREASQTAFKGQFDSDAQEKVLVSFNEHMKGVEDYITKAQEDGRTDDVKAIAVKVGQAIANQAESLAFAQAEVKASADAETQGSLDFLMLRVTSTLIAAANIAASTLLEDEAPDTSDVPATDEWGNPL